MTRSFRAGKCTFGKSEIDVERKDLPEETSLSFNQSCDWSQVEEGEGEGDEMDWLPEDEMRGHWEEVGKEEGNMTSLTMRVERKSERNAKCIWAKGVTGSDWKGEAQTGTNKR